MMYEMISKIYFGLAEVSRILGPNLRPKLKVRNLEDAITARRFLC